MRVSRVFLVFAAVILSLSGAYIYASHSPSFSVTQIVVRGCDKIAADEIKDRLKPCLDRNILGLNLERVQEELRQDVRLKQVKVGRRFPSCLVIDVEEKSAVLWISLPAGVPELGDCGFCGLSIDHEVIPLDRHDLSEDLPMVSGIRVKATQVPEPYHKWCDVKVQKALSLYKTLTLADSSSALLLSEINVTDVANPVLYLLPNTKVMMGEGDLERKWMRVRTILAGVEDIGSFSCLDLRFDDQVLLARSSSAESNLRAGKRAKSSQGK